MTFAKMLSGLATKKGKRKAKRAANVSTRLNKNMQMIKNSQTGNINKSGTVDSAKNKRRQSVAKRQKTKATRLMGKALATGIKKSTARKAKRKTIKNIKKNVYSKGIAKVGGKTKRQAVKQYKKKGTMNPSVKALNK